MSTYKYPHLSLSPFYVLYTSMPYIYPASGGLYLCGHPGRAEKSENFTRSMKPVTGVWGLPCLICHLAAGLLSDEEEEDTCVLSESARGFGGQGSGKSSRWARDRVRCGGRKSGVIRLPFLVGSGYIDSRIDEASDDRRKRERTDCRRWRGGG